VNEAGSGEGIILREMIKLTQLIGVNAVEEGLSMKNFRLLLLLVVLLTSNSSFARIGDSASSATKRYGRLESKDTFYLSDVQIEKLYYKRNGL
jgi:hypothetical protein